MSHLLRATERAWHDPASFATTLVALFLEAHGLVAASWHAETIHAEIEDALHEPPDGALYDRLMAGLFICTTDACYKSLPDFVRIAPILSGRRLDTTITTFPEVEEIAWALVEIHLLGPPEPGDSEPYCNDIRRFIGAACAREGILEPPDVLAIGRIDPARSARARAVTANDPELAAASRQIAAARNGEILDGLRSLLARLGDQLNRADLEEDGRVFVNRLRAETTSKGTDNGRAVT